MCEYMSVVVLSVVCYVECVVVFKQKTAYEMRISDWSSDVCSSDLGTGGGDETPGYGLCDRSGGCLCRAARRGVFARAHPGIRSMVSRAERESRKRIAGSGKDGSHS